MKTPGTFIVIASAAIAIFAATGCGNGKKITEEEKNLICGTAKGQPMRVLTIGNHEDSLALRGRCTDFNDGELDGLFSGGCRDRSILIADLAGKMVTTVTHPAQDGVGIAGPQVGIFRRIVAVQRFDKPGEPFEVYPNIRIIRKRGEMKAGKEGCLSIPGRSGYVERYDTVVIRYAARARHLHFEPLAAMPEGYRAERGDGLNWDYVTETVGGFTAVIFQHECDHLDGILYTDREVSGGQM